MRCYNLPKAICRHLVGDDHSTHHHMIVGCVVMALGVAVAKSVEYTTFPGSHFVLDMVGYAIHGLGLTPFVESALRWVE